MQNPFSWCGFIRKLRSFNEWGGRSGLRETRRTCVHSTACQSPGSQLLLMRPWCHTDHTYCRLLLNLFPRPCGTHTHTLSQVPSSLRAPTATRRLFPTHPTCFRPSISHKEAEKPGDNEAPECGDKSTLTWDAELKRETEPQAVTAIRMEFNTLQGFHSEMQLWAFYYCIIVNCWMDCIKLENLIMT